MIFKRLLSKRFFLLALCVLLFFIAWNRSVNLLYGMFALISATVVVAHVMPRWSLRGISAERRLQNAAFEGDTIGFTVSITNNGATSRYMVEVMDSVPAAAPEMQRPMSFLARVAGRETRSYSYELECYKRGEYVIGPLTLSSSYPLGLSSASKVLKSGHDTLLVYPRIFEIAEFPVPIRSNRPRIGLESLSKAGGGEEFFGTREYRQGDNLRHIHWPSTAKRSQLIVKDFELRGATEVTIIIDLHRDSDIGPGRENTLEYAVKLAASLSKNLLERSHHLQLLGYGQAPCVVPCSGGRQHHHKILETLAKVKADGDTPYHIAIDRGAEMIRDGSVVILIFSRSDSGAGEFIQGMGLLRAKRVRPICIFLNEHSFRDSNGVYKPQNSPLVQAFAAETAHAYFISKGDDIGGVFNT